MRVYLEPISGFLACQICGATDFARREIKMTTTGMTFLELDWLNRSADGAICTRCGYVHTFMGEAHRWTDADDPEVPDDPPRNTWPAPKLPD